MMPFLARTLKRLALLCIGLLLAYVAAREVFPFLDNRTPVVIAVFGTYVIMAYVVIPALFRVVRLFYHPVHLPLYCTTPDGFASDPINIALIGDRKQVILAMEAAGWQLADRNVPMNVLRQVVSALLRQPYPNAPVSRLYLFGRKQDLAFEMELHGRGRRHHVRFWAAEARLAHKFETHARFWDRLHRRRSDKPNAQFWVGAASKDIGFAPIRHNAQLTHMIDPDTGRERRLIVRGLARAGKVVSTRTVSAYRPLLLKNRAWRGFLRSDGKVSICELR